MIGSGLKKFAQARGLKCSGGYAYGLLHGCHIAMDEGAGWKAVHICLFPAPEKRPEGSSFTDQVYETLTSCDLKEHRLSFSDSVTVEDGFARLKFHDTIGTMKRIAAYLDEMLPKIAALGLDANRCAYCSRAMDGDLRYAMLNGHIYPVHSGCVQDFSGWVDRLEDDSLAQGSLAKGTLGAFTGALIGAIAYALVFMLGYITALVGLLIGWLVNKFYTRFGGKRSKLVAPILIVAILFSVVLGQVGGYTLMFARQFDEKSAADYGFTRWSFVQSFWEQYLLYDQETMLTLEYERALEALPEEERVDLMTVEEFIDTYYDAEINEIRNGLRQEFGKNLMLGLFYSLLGSLATVYTAHWHSKRKRVKSLG